MTRRQGAIYFDGEHGDLLGLSAESTRDDVMRAFREKAYEHHPDKGGDPAIFRRLVEARDRALRTAA
jgi:curved DNA-binding protein CbpA